MTNNADFKRELDNPLAALQRMGGRQDNPPLVESRQVRQVAIADLTLDERAQPRVAIRKNVITKYAQDMRNGDVFPPIDVFTDGKVIWVADGFHRTLAAKEAGMTSIAAEFHRGDLDDAILFSLRANERHGLRSTTADKRKSVMKALANPKQKDKSARAIAEACGVSHQTVLNIQKQLEADGSLSNFDSVRYMDRWGNETTMDTSGLKAADRRAAEYRRVLSKVARMARTELRRPETDDERAAVQKTLDELQTWIDQVKRTL